MDSRFFDMFDPPENVICVDLDTNTISWTPDREFINLKMMPKQALSALRSRLLQLNERIERVYGLSGAIRVNDPPGSSNSSNATSPAARSDAEARFKREKRALDLAIRECFLRFMTACLHNYKAFMRTVTKRPDTRQQDRNLAAFFNCDGFVQSKERAAQMFYRELTKTQLFYDCIMNLTFASELDPALADAFGHFDECCRRATHAAAAGNSGDMSPLLELNDLNANHQTVVVLPPSVSSFDNDDRLTLTVEQAVSEDGEQQQTPQEIPPPPPQVLFRSSAFVYELRKSVSVARFPRLKLELGLRGALESKANSTSDLNVSQLTPGGGGNANLLSVQDSGEGATRKSSVTTNNTDTHSIASGCNSQQSTAPGGSGPMTGKKLNKLPNTPIGVRTKTEKNVAAKKFDTTLSAIQAKASKDAKLADRYKHLVAKTRALHLLSNAYALWFIYLHESLKERPDRVKSGLNYAYQVLIQMQTHNLPQPDEICFRTMMQLCLLYKVPTLAVKTLMHMKKYKIEFTPITYSYYNIALMDITSWPSFEQDRWAKLRLMWRVVWAFKYNLRLKQERELKRQKSRSKTQRRSSGKQRRSSNSKTLKRSSVGKQVPPPLSPPVSSNKTTPNTSKQSPLDIASIKEELTPNKSVLPPPQSMPPPESSSETASDPLSAFLTSSQTTDSKNEQPPAPIDDIKKRLFDYKPFADVAQTGKSDFLYPAAKTNGSNALNATPRQNRSNNIINLDSEYKNGTTLSDTDEHTDDEEDEYEYDEDEDEDEDEDGSREDSENDSEDDLSNSDNDADEAFEAADMSGIVRMGVGDMNGEEEDRKSSPRSASSDHQIADSLIDSCMPYAVTTTPVAAADSRSIGSRRDTAAYSLPPPAPPTPQTAATTTPTSRSSMSSRLTSFMHRSVDMAKLKDMGRFISDKTGELRETLMSSAVTPLSGHQELASKLKGSLSGYKLYAANPLNHLVSSNSSGQVHNGMAAGGERATSAAMCDLEPLGEDESIKALTLSWWSVEQEAGPQASVDEHTASADALIDIQMTTCNYCEKCRSFLYDEEIMAAWTFNDSDLSVRCARCSAALVPQLYVRVQDLDSIRRYIVDEHSDGDEAAVVVNNTPEHPFVGEDKDESEKQQASKSSARLSNSHM
ncbi:unnamed protein product, partial [Sphagnum balticum]